MTDPAFADILNANARYADQFHLGVPRPEAAKGLGVLTCIDSRIEPLRMLGLVPGDAKILRNAGGRVTDDALRSLVLAVHFLGVRRIAVIGHTQCKMTEATNEELRAEITAHTSASADGWEFLPIADQHETLVADITIVRECPLIPASVAIAAMVYDVTSGRLNLEATV
jgi:carbonic anhydrase